MKPLCSLICLAISLQAFAQAGAPDPSFGSNGSRIVDFSPTHNKELIQDMQVSPNGEIVLGGLFYEYTAYGAARLTAEGRKDTTFNEDGIYFIQDYYAPIFVAGAVAVLPDRRVIIGGQERSFNDTLPDRLWLKGLKANGHPDPAFGKASVVLTDVSPYFDYAEDISVLPDGRFLVAATINSDEDQYVTPPSMAVLRYWPDGKLDSTFGVNGVARIETPGWPGRYVTEHMAVFPDGRIVVQSIRRISTSSSWQFVTIARLLPDGQLDPGFAFGAGFKVYTISPYHVEDVVALLPLSDGKLFFMGNWRNFYGHDVYYIARLEENGQPDYDLSPSGLLEFEIPCEWDEYYTVQDAVMQPDGKIVLIGDGLFDKMMIARHLPNGKPDPSFGESGYRTYDVPGLGGCLHTALQPNGKIIVAAWVNNYTQVWRFQNDLSGTEEPIRPKAIRLAPNPAGDHSTLYFDTPVSGRLALRNTSGALLRSWVVQNEISLEMELQNLPKGLYFWRFEAENGIWVASGKLMLQ